MSWNFQFPSQQFSHRNNLLESEGARFIYHQQPKKRQYIDFLSPFWDSYQHGTNEEDKLHRSLPFVVSVSLSDRSGAVRRSYIFHPIDEIPAFVPSSKIVVHVCTGQRTPYAAYLPCPSRLYVIKRGGLDDKGARREGQRNLTGAIKHYLTSNTFLRSDNKNAAARWRHYHRSIYPKGGNSSPRRGTKGTRLPYLTKLPCRCFYGVLPLRSKWTDASLFLNKTSNAFTLQRWSSVVWSRYKFVITYSVFMYALKLGISIIIGIGWAVLTWNTFFMHIQWWAKLSEHQSVLHKSSVR